MTSLDRYFGLAGKSTAVTGASSGIGLAMAEGMHAAGAHVVISSDEPDASAAIADRLSANGPRAAGIGCDVRDPSALRDLVTRTQDHLGPIDVLVRDAGVSPHHGPIGEADEAAIEATLGLYALAKAALMRLARNLAVKWGPYGVRANVIAPGLIETSRTTGILSGSAATARRLGMTPSRRVGQPFEAAATPLFLASPDGTFVTGQPIVVDGEP